MGREAKLTNNLTRKQLGFVKAVLDGDSPTQAVLATYNTSDPKVAASIASENLTKPNVKQAIEGALRQQGLSMDVIISNIGKLASSEPVKITSETILKANLELLKLSGITSDQRSSSRVSHSRTVMSYEEAKKELRRLTIFTEEFISEVESG